MRIIAAVGQTPADNGEGMHSSWQMEFLSMQRESHAWKRESGGWLSCRTIGAALDGASLGQSGTLKKDLVEINVHHFSKYKRSGEILLSDDHVCLAHDGVGIQSSDLQTI